MLALLTLLYAAVLPQVVPSPVGRTIQQEAVDYLIRYGYLHRNEDSSDLDTLSSALVSLQEFFGLKVTGELDLDTIELMQSPRCGVMDRQPTLVGPHRKRRYVLLKSKWSIREIKYRILNGPTKGPLNKNDVRKIISQSFGLWTAVTPLKITQQPTKKAAHIDIRFAKKEHGDGEPFDGRGNVLAHAFPPSHMGHTHFDDDELFSYNSSRGMSLLQTAAHEFGHALGLDHSKSKAALMYPKYNLHVKQVALGDDDIKGIQALYGKSRGESYAEEHLEEKGKPNKDLCKDPKVNSIFEQNGELFAIKDDKVYRLVDGGVAPGYPIPTKDVWPQLSCKVDVVLANKAVTAVFCGDDMYYFSHDIFAKGPVPANTFYEGIPSKPDAHQLWNGYHYFFKGGQYWMYDVLKKEMTADSPKPLSTFKGYPSNKVDSVLIHKGMLYFVTGHQHYLIDPVQLEVVRVHNNKRYPQNNGRVWFGCP